MLLLCDFAYQRPMTSPSAFAAELEPSPVSGADVYAAHCAICHGSEGRGDGEAAPQLAVAPRDFVRAQYRFRSTASGKLPTDEDLRRSVARGMGGTAMVAQDHLSEAELDAVVEFIKGLSPRFAEEAEPKPMKLPVHSPKTENSLARGRRVYHTASCNGCHGDGGKGDGTSADDLSLPPTDLTRHPLKGGSTARDIVRAVVTGLNGTPMPSYHLLFDDRDLWDLGYYVESLGSEQGMTAEEKLGWAIERRTPPGR